MSRVYRALEKAEKEKMKKDKGEPISSILKEVISPKEEAAPEKILEIDIKEIGAPEAEEFPFLMAEPDSFAAEQFRKLRTFLFMRSPHPPRLILITSAFPQEGKTTVALNLAFAISQEINKKAILIDADLRMPSIYLKNFENSPGLSNYLMDHLPVEAVMKNSGKEKLWIIPAGKPSSQAAELIGSRRMEELLHFLRNFGEDTYTLIDSPPIVSASEPILLSRIVDGIILVVMADKSPRAAIRKAINDIPKDKILGVVFNQKELKPTKYYSEYYYRKYKKQKD
ncbi:MAG: CpsD/CapB family tyrosine-protein kinase [Thermodesulfobacteriota bacterium]